MPETLAPDSRNVRSRLLPDLLVLGAFCAFLFFFALGAIGLAGADEPRYAQIAREMLARHDWVTPVLYGQPWLEKPVLYYWEAMLSYSVFGVSDWAARIPAALDMSVLVFAAYFFVRRFRRGVELDAALILASCVGIVGFGHAGSTDAPLAATFSLALLTWFTWHKSEKKIWLASFYLLLALGVLAKGPIALVLAAMVILAYAALSRNWQAVRQSLWLPGILLFVAAALPWYVLVQLHTGNFFRVFLLEHNLQRYTTGVYRHTQPFWYFGPVMLVALLPWTVPAIVAFVRAIAQVIEAEKRRRQGTQAMRAGDDLSLFLLLWGILPVIFFSFSGSKLPGYILPAVPPFALLTAVWLRSKLEEESAPNRLLVLLHGLISGGLLAAALVAPYLALHMHPTHGAIMTAAVAGTVVFAIVILSIFRAGLKTMRFVTLLPVVIGLAFLLRTAAPVLDNEFSARPVARQLARLAPPNAPAAAFNVPRELEYGLAFYRNQPAMRYERAEVPAAAHLLVTRDADQPEIERLLAGRERVYLGHSARQSLKYYWVTGRP